jgi:hypothetical protein
MPLSPPSSSGLASSSGSPDVHPEHSQEAVCCPEGVDPLNLIRRLHRSLDLRARELENRVTLRSSEHADTDTDWVARFFGFPS